MEIVDSTPINITNDSLLYNSLPTWGPEFEINVEIKINSWIGDWGSIFCFKAIDGNKDQIGNRIPGLWTDKDTNGSLILATQINDDGDYKQLSNAIGKFELDIWYTFIISQKKEKV